MDNKDIKVKKKRGRPPLNIGTKKPVEKKKIEPK